MRVDEPEIPGYRILRRLGRGGMATVYLAVQEPINRKVALKIMSSHLNEDSVWAKRFIQEAQVIAQLSHPSIVPVFDVGTHDGQFYIAMEYLDGGSLERRMTNGITIPEALKILVGVAAGLDFAGEKGFIHRDIKPDNIMFRNDGSPVILDFGIVKQMDAGPEKMTQTGVIVGTTSYMSPEQAQGRELDHRSDIYSLGVMFFELLTGVVPFKGATDVATLLQHINNPVPRLDKALAVFQPIVDKTLAKDPFHRYARARKMIDHLGELESEIKYAVAPLKQRSVCETTTPLFKPDDDATVVMAGSDSAARGAVTGNITTEEELTKVISSAKATIRDFSAEARAKRARRSKHLIAGVSMVAMMALGYVGYQQLYVVPMEHAVAEEKIRAVELKSRNKINGLLVEAKKAREGLMQTDLERVDMVVAIYRQVLKLEPENKEAQFVLEKFGERYISMARGAVKRRDFDKAAVFREYAEQLVPNSPELPGLRNVIKALRAEQIDKEFVQQEVGTLVALAKTDIDSVTGFSDLAYTKLQQALRLDPTSQQAADLVDKMLSQLYDQTAVNIERGRVSAAQKDLAILEKYYQDPNRLASLQQALARKSAQVSKQQKVSKLMARADLLRRERLTTGLNQELRDIYLSILDGDPNNAKARQGLDDASRFDSDVAALSIAERDFDQAQLLIDTVGKYTPSFSQLDTLKNQLSLGRASAAKADQMLIEAMGIIRSQGSDGGKRKNLMTAYQKIEQAKVIDANNPGIEKALHQLETEYVTTITQLISNDQNTLVNAYFEDAAKIYWPSDRILQLQIAQKNSERKAKPKRVITGGF